MPDTITLHDLYWVLGEQELGPLEFYLADALRSNGKKVNYYNIHKFYPGYWHKLNIYSHRFPRRVDNAVRNKFIKIINDVLIRKYNSDKPSHIFIYNDCLVMPDTLEHFRKNGTRIIVFLGDDPNYLYPAKKTFLLTVLNADLIVVPDSGWIEGLKVLDVGDEKIYFSAVGTDENVFRPVEPTDAQKMEFAADILFVGTGYFLNAWGIKRASVLNALSSFNMKIFGDKLWYELFPYFPDLEKKFINRPLSSDEVNTASSCSKIYPVVVNSGVINGASTRVFDGIASGIFVLPEFKKDIEVFFPGGEVDCFRSKKDLKDKTEYYLKNENEKTEMKNKARELVLKKYTLKTITGNILERLGD
ncbi:MAG: glycosyltransferase [Bacteroidetes bacterium]|nr:glycosyltransferase [Bacteroidota bacterium]